MIKKVSLIISVLLIPLDGWSWSLFYGSPPPQNKIFTIFKKDKMTRKLVFLQLDAVGLEDEKKETVEEDFEKKRKKERISDESTEKEVTKKKKIINVESLMQRQFGEDLLRSLYLKFKGIPQITISTNDLITSWDQDAANYDVRIYSNYIVEEPDSWVDKDTRERRRAEQEEIQKRKKLFEVGEEEKQKMDDSSKENEEENSSENIFDGKKNEKQEKIVNLKKKKLKEFTTEELNYLNNNVETLKKWKRKNFSNQAPVHETVYKRENWEEISFFFLKKGVEYIDARLPNFDESTLKKDDDIQEILIWDKDENTGQLEKVIYRETNRYKRELKVQNSSIKVIRQMMLPQIIKRLREEEQVDFAVHVQLMQGVKRGETKIQIYLIRTSSGEMELIYKSNFFISNLQKHVDLASSKLLASLQGVPLINNIQFISKEKDVHVYLDDAYIGKTPLKINYPAGVYQFRFWKGDHEWDADSTFQLNSNKLMLNYVSSEKSKTKIAHINLWLRLDSRVSREPIHILFKKKETIKKLGYIFLQPHIDVPQSKVFLDNLLVGIFQKNIIFPSTPGEKILSLWPPGYRGVDGIVPVRPDFISMVDVKYLPIPNYEQIEKRADVYKISSRILSLSGGFSFLLWFTSFFLANQSWDKKTLLEKVYVKKNINFSNSETQVYQKYQDTFSAIRYGALYSSLGLFSLGVAFKILEIKTRVTSVYDPNRQDKNFKIRYIPVKNFSFHLQN